MSTPTCSTPDSAPPTAAARPAARRFLARGSITTNDVSTTQHMSLAGVLFEPPSFFFARGPPRPATGSLAGAGIEHPGRPPGPRLLGDLLHLAAHAALEVAPVALPVRLHPPQLSALPPDLPHLAPEVP